MLPRAIRLSRKGFETLTHSRRAASEHFSLSFQKNTTQGGSAVIISKKIITQAVKRHEFKRRVRAIVLPHSNQSTKLVVYGKKGAGALPYKKMENELLELLQSILG